MSLRRQPPSSSSPSASSAVSRSTTAFFTPSGTYNGTVNQLQDRRNRIPFRCRNTAVVQAAKKVSPAVVGITTKVYNRDMFNRKVLVGEGVGSGVIFDKAGYIVTNNHVVGTAKTVIVSLADGQSTEGTVVGRDEKDGPGRRQDQDGQPARR